MKSALINTAIFAILGSIAISSFGYDFGTSTMACQPSNNTDSSSTQPKIVGCPKVTNPKFAENPKLPSNPKILRDLTPTEKEDSRKTGQSAANGAFGQVSKYVNPGAQVPNPANLDMSSITPPKPSTAASGN